ncbi:ATP-binding protein [Microcella sp.]|uniref:ATP-binding protein n=1 Tax=Microcella sp. TaxID=1913979 RepID=UPI00299F84AA|nr:ATP-binding protein [Microcella sp.]MDX2026606.1 ATP-binding protein [Microcella sp.]
MDARGLAARIHDLDALPRRSIIAVMIAAIFGVAMWSLNAQSPDLPTALWWPAMGMTVIVVLMSRGRRLAVLLPIFVVLTTANFLGGRPLELAIAYGFANITEAWIVVRLLTRGRRHVPFTTLPHIGRFLIVAVVGPITFAVIAATAATIVLGVDPIALGLTFMTSHASALFVIVPLALVPLTVPRRAPRWEPIVQSLALALLIAVVFVLVPSYALTFLIITTLMWGAFRLPPLVPAVQSLVLALFSVAMTASFIGPFGLLVIDDLRGGVIALQLFMMTHAAAGLFVSGQSAEWFASAEALAARERDANRVADELRELNEQKDHFIASVSHELRTPVTSILGFAEELTDNDDRDTETATAGRIIYRNARRLADVIEDVLELSRLTTQSSTRPLAEFDVRRLLHDCIEDATGLVSPARNVHVQVVVPEHPVIMMGVEQDLARVCANLLSNAIKFSPAGATVTVTLDDDDPDELEFRVADEGPGIPLAEQEAVWDRFYRVQSPRHSDVPGTGLGLPIVRALVQQRMGGSIELHSDGEHGTTVVVRAPRRRVTLEGSGVESRQDDSE